MPDGVHEPFVPKINVYMPPEPEPGFTPRNTSGFDAATLEALNRALGRLMARGLAEREAKLALHYAVAEWLEPRDAAEADLERLLAWR